MPKTDYTLAPLRYYTGQRPTEPDATTYGKDNRNAAMRLLSIAVVLAAVALSGCGGEATPAPKTAATPAPAPTTKPKPSKARRARQVRHALHLGGYDAPVVAVGMDSATDVQVGTIGDPKAICNNLVNGYAPPAWMTHLYVSSTNKGSASWMPGDPACR